MVGARLLCLHCKDIRRPMVVAVLALTQEYLVLSLCAISAHPSLNYTSSCKKSSLKTLVSSLQEEVKRFVY